MAFLQLSARRQSGMAVNPLTYGELEAFCRLTKVEFSAWQVSVLMRLDDLALRVSSERKDGKKPRDETAATVEPTKGISPVRAMLIERAMQNPNLTKSPGAAK